MKNEHKQQSQPFSISHLNLISNQILVYSNIQYFKTFQKKAIVCI